MPKFRDGFIGEYTGNYSISPVRLTREPKEKTVENIQSMMSRFKDYTENMGMLQKCSLGISRIQGRISLEDFCSSIEIFIKETFKSDPYKKMIDELNQYLLNKIPYQIDSTRILKSRSFNYLSFVMQLADEYINKIYEGKRLQQADKFEKCATIVNILYAMLLANYVVDIREHFDEYSQDASHLWRLTYEMGFLQGEMCLIESHLDADMKMIHHGRVSSQAIDEDWPVRYKKIQARDKIRDLQYEKPLKYAEDEWKKEKKIIYHNKMADEIIKKFPRLGIERLILIEKLKPIARKYRYSEFCGGEFKSKPDIKILCQVINNDKYGIKLNIPEYTIDRLNEIIRTPDFYSKWFKRKGIIDLSPEADELIGDTHGCRKKKFPELTEEEQRKIKRLNRLLLEQTYPSIVPKSLPRGLMKGPEWKRGTTY